MKHLWRRAAALILAAVLCLAPAAQALTPAQLLELLDTYYIDEIPQAAREAGTVEEILQALGDPYTLYMTAEEYEAFQASMRDTTLVGIGITGQTDPEGLLITIVHEDSPAQDLGLVPGDLIIRVDGQDAAGQSTTTISGWLRGEEGAPVTLTVRHADGREADYTALRAQIIIPAVITTMLEDGTTAYIQCTTFGEDTLGHMLEGVEDSDANLWLVDLRQNGGGDVYATAQTLGVFLGKGTMAYLRDGEDAVFRYVSNQDSATLYPVIVLTSGGTASAAELFAQAVKDKSGGMVIGSNTFGKGVAQVILAGTQEPEVFTEGDAIRITAYQFYGVEGNIAQDIGVIPDLLVNTNSADEIARLFSSKEPVGDKSGWLRLHLGGWRWYLDLENAMTEENAPYFAQMLSALPPGAEVFQGENGQWKETSGKAVAERTGVAGYEPRVFSDVSGLPCEKAANTLRTYEMLMGYEDGTFRPENTLTRAELCALLVQAMGLRDNGGGTAFTDVAPESWYAPYIRAAETVGYVAGMGDGTFDPQGTVTHEQLFTVLGRLAADLNLTFYMTAKEIPEETGVPEAYSDWAEPWAWLLALSQKNIFGNTLSMLYADLEDIAPQTPASRGETAQVLYNILSAVNLLNY